jgi:hypothetical protein
MSPALTKTLSLLLLIVIGYIFQKKIHSKDQREGIKTLILGLALPATILVALLQIEFQSELIVIPVMSLGFNIILYLLIDKLPLQPIFNVPSSQYRSLVMLLPSLAPGLSCFPFIIEYSGQSALAMAALADVGNKIFVLIISYTIAMKWFYTVNHVHKNPGESRLKNLLIAMANEPVNIVIVVAIGMLSFGFTYTAFPETVTMTIDRLSGLMTPMVLLFIGLSMKLSWNQIKTIFSFLFFRSGIGFAISGVFLYFFRAADLPTLLLIVVFPQSACSFWPYAHMTAVGQMENKLPGDRINRTFDLDFAMNVLACSMPFSVVIIMIVYAWGNVFAHPIPVFICSGAFIIVGTGIVLISSKASSRYKAKMVEMKREQNNKESAQSRVS